LRNLMTPAIVAMLQTPDGKPQNSYGYNDECLNKEFTIGVIEETHGFWNKLRSGERENSEELALQ
jgi:inorganic pyrophosphatase